MKNLKLVSYLTLGLLLGGGSIAAAQVFAQGNTVATPQTASLAPSNSTVNVSDKNKNDIETKDDNQDPTVLASQAKINEAEARQIAQKNAGGVISSIKLGDENGTVVYEVRIGQKDLVINASNGKVLKSESADQKDGDQVEMSESQPEVQDANNTNEKEDAAKGAKKDQEILDDNSTATVQN